MLRWVNTGEFTYLCTPSEITGEVISTIPLSISSELEGCPETDGRYLQVHSPAARAIAAKNCKVFNINNYENEDYYRLAVRRLLEILPGRKSVLFFGGDFVELNQLNSIICVAGSIQEKTWLIKTHDTAMLNSYYLHMTIGDVSLPENVWLYTTDTSAENSYTKTTCKLHNFPTIIYEKVNEHVEELEQFPSEYSSFKIKICQKK